MSNTERHAETVERLQRAADMGLKVSYIIKTAKLSKFRINCIISELPYARTKTKGLTDEEAKAINDSLDFIKDSL